MCFFAWIHRVRTATGLAIDRIPTTILEKMSEVFNGTDDRDTDPAGTAKSAIDSQFTIHQVQENSQNGTRARRYQNRAMCTQ